MSTGISTSAVCPGSTGAHGRPRRYIYVGYFVLLNSKDSE